MLTLSRMVFRKAAVRCHPQGDEWGLSGVIKGCSETDVRDSIGWTVPSYSMHGQGLRGGIEYCARAMIGGKLQLSCMAQVRTCCCVNLLEYCTSPATAFLIAYGHGHRDDGVCVGVSSTANAI